MISRWIIFLFLLVAPIAAAVDAHGATPTAAPTRATLNAEKELKLYRKAVQEEVRAAMEHRKVVEAATAAMTEYRLMIEAAEEGHRTKESVLNDREVQIAQLLVATGIALGAIGFGFLGVVYVMLPQFAPDTDAGLRMLNLFEWLCLGSAAAVGESFLLAGVALGAVMLDSRCMYVGSLVVCLGLSFVLACLTAAVVVDVIRERRRRGQSRTE